MNSLEINGKPNQIDITDAFFNTISHIKYGTIVKSPQFKLLHGTHALEVMNPKLDSSLLPTVHFDLDSLNSMHQTNSVIFGLLRSLCAWLDNNSLGVSVFSCSCIERLLINYNTYGKDFLVFDDLQSQKNPKKKPNLPPQSVTNPYKDFVLRTFCLGLLQFVRFIIKVGMSGVIYQEEDLNTQTMDLRILEDVPLDETKMQIMRVQKWLDGKSKSMEINFCIQSMELINSLLEIPSLLQFKMEPFQKKGEPRDMLLYNVEDKLRKSLNILKDFTKEEDYISSLPTLDGCFSTNVQKRFNNHNPPKDIILLPVEATINNLHEMISDSLAVLNITKTQNCLELIEYLKIIMDKRVKTESEDDILGMHVVARAWLQLFLIRDDESILGSSSYNIRRFLSDLMQSICAQNSRIFSLDKLNDYTIGLNEMIAAMKMPFYDFLTCVSQNPSRQRQVIGKEIMYWNQIQEQCENLHAGAEIEFPDHYGNDTIFMPLASFCFYCKIVKMVEIQFKSIELNLCKDLWGLNVNYSSLSNLLSMAIDQINQLLKKIRARQTQLSLGQCYRIRTFNENPSIHRSDADLNYEWRYLNLQLTKYSIYNELVKLKMFELGILDSLGYIKLPKLCKASEEQLYKLQKKPFEGVSYPSVIPFDHYNTTRKNVKKMMSDMLSESGHTALKASVHAETVALVTLFRSLKTQLAEIEFPDFLSKEISADAAKLKRSSVITELSIGRIAKWLTETPSNATRLKVTINRLNNHLYFPEIHVELGK